MLVQCFVKISECVNHPVLHKAISQRLNNLTKLSGYTFFKELVEIIDSANIKERVVTPWNSGPKIKEFNIISIWQLASEILGDLNDLFIKEPRAVKIMSEYLSGLISHLDFLSEIIGDTTITVSNEQNTTIERNLKNELAESKELFLNILIYSYGKGAKVADIIKMLKESGFAQDFFSFGITTSYVFIK